MAESRTTKALNVYAHFVIGSDNFSLLVVAIFELQKIGTMFAQRFSSALISGSHERVTEDDN